MYIAAERPGATGAQSLGINSHSLATTVTANREPTPALPQPDKSLVHANSCVDIRPSLGSSTGQCTNLLSHADKVVLFMTTSKNADADLEGCSEAFQYQ